MSGIKFLNVERWLRSIVRIGLGLLLVSPYLIWLIWIPSWDVPHPGAWLKPLLISLFQAFVSAAISVAVGFLLFQAAQGWTSRGSRRLAEAALLLPNTVPPLFLVLALLSWVTPLGITFPYGLGAVIMAHVLMNSGLVAVSVDRMVHSKLSGMTETAWVLGASKSQFWGRVAWPYLKGDLACVFLFVFSLCFTSFSIPLVLGGRQAATLEVAIFDTIRMDGRWDLALVMAACQSLILFLLALALPRPFWPTQAGRRSLRFLNLPGLKLLVFLPSVILLLGWVWGGLMSLAVPFDPALKVGLIDAALTTVTIALAVGLLHLFILLLVAYVTPHRGLDRFLNGYLAPSPAITGFALLLLPGESETLALLKLVLALTLISFPLLYRWLAHGALASLQKQVIVARSLGSSWVGIVIEIVWPQAAPQLLRVCGLAALWACGDFALSGILAGPLLTVPLVMQDLMANYQIEAAQLMMFPLLILGVGIYGAFVGAARYVAR